MEKQSEALRLADALQETAGCHLDLDAAAELRRLHELRLEDAQRIADLHAENHRLADINAQLLEALDRLYDAADGFSVSGVYFNEEHWGKECLGKAAAAIEAARRNI